MKNLLILIIASLFAYLQARACLNELSVTATGKEVITDDLRYIVPKGVDHVAAKAKYEDKLLEHKIVWEKTQSIDSYSDYGLYLILLGRYEEAKVVFKEIEVIVPDRYATAANIGTLYELVGQNDSALYWIKESVRLYPAAHDSSEWLHVKILEAKIKGITYITSQFLLGVDFGNKPKPETDLSTAQLKKLGRAIYYQLNERMSFIKPEEPIVALLLFELGNITSFTISVENAIANFRLAKEYGYDSEVMGNRWAVFSGMHNEVSEYNPIDDAPPLTTDSSILSGWFFAVVILVSLGALAAWYFFRRNKERP
ncbi:hypothetical protein BH09BAC1_BH09BAC1_12280 [soil metagenome]